MDISKCFSGSLRLRDNESRLYLFLEQSEEKEIYCICMWSSLFLSVNILIIAFLDFAFSYHTILIVWFPVLLVFNPLHIIEKKTSESSKIY